MDQLLPSWTQSFRHAVAAEEYWELVCETAELRWGDQVTCNFFTGVVQLDSGTAVSIANLARTAPHQDLAARRRGLYHLFATADDVRKSADRPKDWTWAKSRLRSRLQVKWDPPWELMAQSVDVQTNRIVALDHPAGCAPVAITQAERWGVDSDQIWDTAIAQSIGQPGIRHCDVGAGVHRFEGGLFTSGITSDLRYRLPEPLGHLGALVTCPTARVTYVNPLWCLDDLRTTIGRLLHLAVLRHGIEQNPITTSILWYRSPGTLEPAVAVTRRREIHLGPAEPFVSLFDIGDPPSAA